MCLYCFAALINDVKHCVYTRHIHGKNIHCLLLYKHLILYRSIPEAFLVIANLRQSSVTELIAQTKGQAERQRQYKFCVGGKTGR